MSKRLAKNQETQFYKNTLIAPVDSISEIVVGKLIAHIKKPGATV